MDVSGALSTPDVATTELEPSSSAQTLHEDVHKIEQTEYAVHLGGPLLSYTPDFGGLKTVKNAKKNRRRVHVSPEVGIMTMHGCMGLHDYTRCSVGQHFAVLSCCIDASNICACLSLHTHCVLRIHLLYAQCESMHTGSCLPWALKQLLVLLKATNATYN